MKEKVNQRDFSASTNFATQLPRVGLEPTLPYGNLIFSQKYL